MLPVRDLQDEPEPAAAAGRMIAADAHEPLCLDRPPLLRVGLLRLTEGEHILLVTVHHIVADGLSLNVLMRELNQAYGAFAAGSAPILAPLPVQATDIAVWQEQQIATGALRPQQAYWVEKLSGPIHSLELPVDRPRPPEQQFRGDQIALHLSSDRELLQRGCKDQGVSLFMLLVAALKVVLHQATGADDILVGSPVANRERPEIEGQIGHYLNTVVLRDTVHRNETFAVLLQRVRTTVTEALAHQSYPFDLLVEELAPRPAAGHQPLFDVQINLMPGDAPSLRLGELSVEGLATNSGTTIFDLNFMFSETASGLALEIGYATALFEPATVARLGNALLRVLVAAAREPGRTVRSLCALVDGEDGELEESRLPQSIAAAGRGFLRQCGVAGCYTPHDPSRFDLALLARMTDALAHRGPDDMTMHRQRGSHSASTGWRSSIWQVGGSRSKTRTATSFWCATARFSITAICARSSKARGHRFRAEVDVEVLVHLYEEFGLGLLDRINGQFALHCTTRAGACCCWRAIPPGSLRCSMYGETIRFCSAPRSSRCWNIRWWSAAPTSRVSTRSWPFRAWSVHGPCSRACAASRPGSLSWSRQAV